MKSLVWNHCAGEFEHNAVDEHTVSYPATKAMPHPPGVGFSFFLWREEGRGFEAQTVSIVHCLRLLAANNQYKLIPDMCYALVR